jgi:hypothetical protein
MAKSLKRGHAPRKVLRIADLEHSKIAVLNSLPAKASQVSYEYAIDEFVSWCTPVLGESELHPFIRPDS